MYVGFWLFAGSGVFFEEIVMDCKGRFLGRRISGDTTLKRRATANLSPADSKTKGKIRFRLRPADGLNEIRYRPEAIAKESTATFPYVLIRNW